MASRTAASGPKRPCRRTRAGSRRPAAEAQTLSVTSTPSFESTKTWSTSGRDAGIETASTPMSAAARAYCRAPNGDARPVHVLADWQTTCAPPPSPTARPRSRPWLPGSIIDEHDPRALLLQQRQQPAVHMSRWLSPTSASSWIGGSPGAGGSALREKPGPADRLSGHQLQMDQPEARQLAVDDPVDCGHAGMRDGDDVRQADPSRTAVSLAQASVSSISILEHAAGQREAGPEQLVDPVVERRRRGSPSPDGRTISGRVPSTSRTARR